MNYNETEHEIRQRQTMVEQQMRRRGIRDERVLEVMAGIPRQNFVPAEIRKDAYKDQPLSIGYGQTISQPYMVALMTEALELKPDDVVLEIGTGCGYQTAILARLCREVYTIEIHEALTRQAQINNENLGIDNVRYHTGNGRLGWPEFREFDRIIVAAGSADIPPRLLAQLVDGGRMVIPVDKGEGQQLLLVEKKGEQFESRNLCWCRFVPLMNE